MAELIGKVLTICRVILYKISRQLLRTFMVKLLVIAAACEKLRPTSEDDQTQ